MSPKQGCKKNEVLINGKCTLISTLRFIATSPSLTRKLNEEKEIFFKKPGVKIDVTFKKGYPGSKKLTCRNVTEIHKNYRLGGPPEINTKSGNIAFESTVHHTGWTPQLKNIKKIRVYPEKRKAKKF